MKEMIKKYKGTLICSVLVMLAGILVGFTMAPGIDAEHPFPPQGRENHPRLF